MTELQLSNYAIREHIGAEKFGGWEKNVIFVQICRKTSKSSEKSPRWWWLSLLQWCTWWLWTADTPVDKKTAELELW